MWGGCGVLDRGAVGVWIGCGPDEDGCMPLVSPPSNCFLDMLIFATSSGMSSL